MNRRPTLRIGVGIAVSILVLTMIAGDVYRFIYIDDGIRYFSENPGRLLWVGLIALAGGLVTVVVGRFSPATQRRLKIVVLCGVGIALALMFLGLAWTLVTLDPVISENMPRHWLVMGCVACLTPDRGGTISPTSVSSKSLCFNKTMDF